MDGRVEQVEHDSGTERPATGERCIVCGGMHVETTHSRAIILHSTAPRISERTRRFCCCDCGARYSRTIELREITINVRVQRGAIRRSYG